MSETETSAIDSKIEETNKASQPKGDVIGFITNSAIITAIIIGYYGISSLVLYSCKLAQSNILPTDEKCFPYTDSELKIDNTNINIFPTYDSESKTWLSKKIQFPYNEKNKENKMLDIIRNYETNPDSHFIGNFFTSIMKSIFSMNYSSINTILNMLNGAPELLIVILGPVILNMLILLLIFINHFYIIYLWFANMSWFFKRNTNVTHKGTPVWEDTGGYFIGICCIFLFLMLFFILFSTQAFFFVILFSTIWCVFSCFGYEATTIINEKITKISTFTKIKEVFKNFKMLFVSVILFCIFITAVTKLDIMSSIIFLIILICGYSGLMAWFMLFSKINKEHLSKFNDNVEQPKKECIHKPVVNKKESGFFSYFGFGGGNKHIATELKKIGKRMDKK